MSGLDIQVTDNATPLVEMAIKQMPFTIATALNATANHAQDAIRQHATEAFTLRRQEFMLRTIKREGGIGGDFATKDNPVARVRLAQPGQDFRTPLFAKFEVGGEIVHLDRDKPIAIPTQAIRPSFTDLPAPSLYPKNLRLVSRRDVKGILPSQKRFHLVTGIPQWFGKRRTFVLDPMVHKGVHVWGVYQRTGPGPHDFRLIWTYKQRIPIPAKLHFLDTGQRAAAQYWQSDFDAAFQRAMFTAR